jgi:hypothetical protein
MVTKEIEVEKWKLILNVQTRETRANWKEETGIR